jgi:hemolysin activation/secretion protein
VLAVDQAGLKSAGRFSKKNFEFRRLQKITDNTNLLLAVQGQMGSKNLMSAERFSLGGADGVRAYPTGEGLGDTGYIFQAEFRYLIPGFKVAGGDMSLSGFYDQGWVRINENALPATGNTVNDQNNKRLSGYGIGASLGKDTDFILRMSAAWRNENEQPTSDTAPRIPRVWVQGIKWF